MKDSLEWWQLISENRCDGYSHLQVVLVVEPDYLPDSEVLCFSAMFIPHETLHPKSMYTLPRGGVQRGGTPSMGFGGSGGKQAPSGGSGAKRPKQKLPYKSIL